MYKISNGKMPVFTKIKTAPRLRYWDESILVMMADILVTTRVEYDLSCLVHCKEDLEF